jgi:hypothetical protein
MLMLKISAAELAKHWCWNRRCYEIFLGSLGYFNGQDKFQQRLTNNGRLTLIVRVGKKRKLINGRVKFELEYPQDSGPYVSVMEFYPNDPGDGSGSQRMKNILSQAAIKKLKLPAGLDTITDENRLIVFEAIKAAYTKNDFECVVNTYEIEVNSLFRPLAWSMGIIVWHIYTRGGIVADMSSDFFILNDLVLNHYGYKSCRPEWPNAVVAKA